jgi:hypothetical protein
MPTFSWPTSKKWIPASGSFRARAITQSSISPYTSAYKGSSLGSVWVAKMDFPARTLDDGYELQAFLDGLEGPTNPVYIPNWNRPSPRYFGDQVGAPFSDGTFFTDGTGWNDPGWSLTVNVAAVRGARAIAITGFPVNSTVLYPGDVLQVGSSMIEVQTLAISDGGGLALVSVLPGLRTGIAQGTPIISFSPKVLMRMMSDAEMVRNLNVTEPVTLEFAEAIDQI